MATVVAGLLFFATNAHAGASTFDGASASSAALTIRVNNSGVQGLGHFHPKRNPTVGPAVAAFGRPSARRPRYGGEGCEVFWRNIGLKIFFSYYGGGGKRAACQPHRGVAKSALIRGPRADPWRTSRGVAIGDSLGRLESRYPNAIEFEGAYWLATGYTPIGEGSSYPVLEATIRSGSVFSFGLSMSPTYD
jgi:hypothetical protein